MFVVFGFFGLFLDAGKPMRLVPVFFVATILVAGALGAAVSHFYSEPMNRYLRNYPRRPRRERQSFPVVAPVEKM